MGIGTKDETGRCGRGGQRANQTGGLGSVCGVGVSVWFPSSPSLLRIPHRQRFTAAAAAAATIPPPIRSVAVEYDVRDGRGSILWRVEGVHERLWHAHTPRQAGVDLRTRIPYANLFPPLCQQLC